MVRNWAIFGTHLNSTRRDLSEKAKKKFLKKKYSKAKISKMVRNWAIFVTRFELNSSRSFRKSEKKNFEKKKLKGQNLKNGKKLDKISDQIRTQFLENFG